MRRFRFNPRDQLIPIRAHVSGPLGRRRLNLILDTGASRTLIVPHLLDELGYSARQGEARTIIRSPAGNEPGYLIRVNQFRALGHAFDGFRVHAHDLADEDEIDGLLGLDFLRLFDLQFRFEPGIIEAQRNSLLPD